MDAITLLKNDHKTVQALFRKYEQLGARAHKSKRATVDRISRELSVHAAIEEQVLYPAARAALADDAMVLEALEEHLIVKWELSALAHLDPSDERFDAKVTVLIENVRHHVKEEEGDFFPKLREVFSRTELRDLGDALERAKKTAPTRPHPMLPDEPPGNLVGGAAALVDRARDAGERAVGRVREEIAS
ncbi:MAG TPA: hemerythrin domain-containing protein [Acidimicrobiia bacterium]